MASDGQSRLLSIPGYEIIRPIGRGGLGEVYLARQLPLGPIVALEILSMTSCLY
jgi:serine/threonine protein kinase